MRLKSILGLACAASMSVLLADNAFAQATVKIGAIFPLTGGAASAGLHAKAALEVAMDIINNAHPEFGDFPLAKSAGLSGLGGAKVEVVFADNQGSPATGQNQALRLITEEKVVALTGAYQSGITLTASAISEKYGIPFLTGESVAANLTERGFKFFFRTTPIAPDFVNVYYRLHGRHEGRRRQDRQRRHRPRQHRIRQLGRRYPQDRVQGQGTAGRARRCLSHQRHRPAEPGAAAQGEEARRPDHDLLHVGCDPVRQDHAGAGLQAADDHCRRLRLFRSVLHQGGRQDLSRACSTARSWSVGPAGSPTALIAKMYKDKTGDDLDDTAGREMQGFFVLVDAINRAGSTEPAKVQAALKATDLKPNQLMMGYKGVKFDDKGQNILASAVIIQLQDGENYVPVWPKANAEKAPVFPFKGW